MTQSVTSRVQNRWIRMGFFQSINPVIKYQPGKANVIADALSRSRGQREDDSTGPSLNVLTRSSLVDSSEIQLWKTAQEDDPVCSEILQRWQQEKEQMRGPYVVTPQGLLCQVKGDRRVLMVCSGARRVTTDVE